MPKHKKKRHNNDDDRRPSHHRRDPCLPPHKKTYLTIGQDLYSIEEYLREQQNATMHWYMRSVARHHNNGSGTDDDDNSDYKSRIPVPRPEREVPAALMVYTDIQKLEGLDTPIDYGSGIEYADGALRMTSPPNNYLGLGLQIGLWLGGAKGCRDIIHGKLDDKVDQLVDYLGEKCPARKIWLRIGYEFDNPEFKYSTDPESYKKAFEYIVDKCQKKSDCRRRVVMVWHSWAAGLPSNATLEDFYPGDEYVDWIGVSVFQQFYPNDVGGTVADLEQVLDFADDHKKPAMIAESTPFGGIHDNAILGQGADIWKAWFQPTLNLIEEYDIAMWSYINCNWDVQPLWIYSGFGDTRLSSDPNIMDQWYDHVTGSRSFIRATDHELCAYEYEYDDDDNFPFTQSIKNSRNRYDDDGYSKDDRELNKSRWVWGRPRLKGGDGLWEAVLPLVMLLSSLAIVLFLFFTSGRPRSKNFRTPRSQRVRFALLDAQEDDDDGSAALYGSIGSMDASERSSKRWRRSVRRVGRNLLVANTSDGSTIVA